MRVSCSRGKCYNCSRIGHFSKLCLSKNKNVNTVDTTHDQDFVMIVNASCHSVSYPIPYVNGTVVPLFAQHGCSVPLKIDTGVDVYILSKSTYVKTFQDPYLSSLQILLLLLSTHASMLVWKCPSIL